MFQSDNAALSAITIAMGRCPMMYGSKRSPKHPSTPPGKPGAPGEVSSLLELSLRAHLRAAVARAAGPLLHLPR